MPLDESHDRDFFISGNEILDVWFRKRAQKNEDSGASRTFVSCLAGSASVVGYYTLAASSVALDRAPGAVRRNMPQPIPVLLLGRLAVDQRHRGAGLGASLLQDAILKTARAADIVGVRALLVHAIDDEAVSFYRHHGFSVGPDDPQTLFLTLKTIRASISAAH